MSPAASQVVRELFLSATRAGPAKVPATVQRLIGDMATEVPRSAPPDTLTLEQELQQEFSFREALYSGQTPKSGDVERWTKALRWVLQELRTWRARAPKPSQRLQVLLAAVSAFDAENEGLDSILQDLAQAPLVDDLGVLLEAAGAAVPAGGGVGPHSEIQAASQSGNYESLELLTRRLVLGLPPDVRVAIHLLWRLRPDLLARVIKQKQDPFFSYAVRQVLDSSALEFALGVDDLTFKFFSAKGAADEVAANARTATLDAFSDLLLQVANTPHWRAWLDAFYRYPQGGRLSEEALSTVLARLSSTQWADFVNAVQLWTHASTAAPVANILVRFFHAVGGPAAREMWSLAYRRWDEWDYGRAEDNTHMSAPSACSLDFPVAMYYAHLSPEETRAEEERLALAVDRIEHEWFSSLSDLMTQRNRLASRLRLVRHGQALASGSTQEPLPPAPRPDGEYAALRYHYHDVNAPLNPVHD